MLATSEKALESPLKYVLTITNPLCCCHSNMRSTKRRSHRSSFREVVNAHLKLYVEHQNMEGTR